MSIFFGFAIADSMFPENCDPRRRKLTPAEVLKVLDNEDVEMCLNPHHKATIDAAINRYNFNITIPPEPPKITLKQGDSVIVMSVRGLPRLDATRHEYTQDEIAKAEFAFGIWTV